MVPNFPPQGNKTCHPLTKVSVARSCLTLWDSMDYSMPVFPVLHYLLESAQTHVHWVSDGIQPFHPLSSPSPLTFYFIQHQGLFQWISSLHQVGIVLELQLQHRPFSEYSGLISFRIDWFDFLVVYGTLKSLYQYNNLKPSIPWCSAFFMVHLSHPYITTGKNHNFDYTDLCQQWCSCLLIGCLGFS